METFEMSRYYTLVAALCTLILFADSADLRAQGSIFGEVRNSDLSFPVDSQINFIGFLNDTDDEIRIESVDGAGYNVGNWFDDFQNYLNEAPGIPYRYLFFNDSNSEGAVLAKLVPSNSFQIEDISLAPVPWPESPSPISAAVLSGYRVRIKWNYQAGVEYHIYRRTAPANGSFYRIDDPSGNLLAGVADTMFIDSAVSLLVTYDYLVASVNPTGDFSPHSEIVNIEVGEGCCLMRGDFDRSGAVDITDLSFIVDYLFGGGPPAECPDESDLDASGATDISDLSYIVDYLFGGGPAPEAC